MKYLILGASSYIGKYIYDKMKESMVCVMGTYCYAMSEEGLIHFDILSDDIEQFLDSMKVLPDIAIICIGQTNFDRCADAYMTAYAVNVECMKKLICGLAARNIKVIYISTDNVFDGKRGNYTELDETNPIGKYGMMKKEMECYILNNLPQMCILRIAKPISDRPAKRNLLTEWEHKKKEGKEIVCIKDNIMSFTAMKDLFKICLLIGERNLQGLYHIAGDKAYSRRELAIKFFQYIGEGVPQIRECELKEFGFKDIRPLNTSMSNQKFKLDTGYDFMPVEEVIKAYVERMV